MVTVEYKEAVVEVLGLINEMEETEKSKIPSEIIQFFEENKSETYKPDINYSDDIRKLKLKEKTKEILAGLYIDYFCDEDKKQGYINKIRMNDIKRQEMLKQKYDVDDMFNNRVKQNSLIVQTKKERIFAKFIKKIKEVLKGIIIN